MCRQHEISITERGAVVTAAIGLLEADVESEQCHAFDESDLLALQSLANAALVNVLPCDKVTAVESFAAPAVVIVKHLSPCGIATAGSPAAAFPLALASDPVSAFGSVVAVNRPVDQAFAEAVAAADLFIEAVIAPQFSAEAQSWFAAKKKNCRLVAVTAGQPAGLEVRSIRQGFLVQEPDLGDPARWFQRFVPIMTA